MKYKILVENLKQLVTSKIPIGYIMKPGEDQEEYKRHKVDVLDKIPIGYIMKPGEDQEEYKRHIKNFNEKKDSFYGSDMVQQLHDDLSKRFRYDSEEERNLRMYTKKSFELNSHLLGHHVLGLMPKNNLSFYDDNLKYELPHLDRATNRRLGRNLVVFSGTGSFNPSKHIKKVRNPYSRHIERLVHFPAFTSTSISKSAASDFAFQSSDDEGKSHMIRLQLSPHDRGAYLGHISKHEQEYEYLLPRNTTIKIHRSEPDKDNPKIIIHHATVVDHIDPEHIERNPDDIHKMNHNMLKFLHSDEESHPVLRRHIYDNYIRPSKSIHETDRNYLHSIRNHPSDDVKWGIVNNPNVHPDTLHDMVNDRNKKFLASIIENPNVQQGTIDKIHEKYGNDPSLLKTILKHSKNPAHFDHAMGMADKMDDFGKVSIFGKMLSSTHVPDHIMDRLSKYDNFKDKDFELGLKMDVMSHRNVNGKLLHNLALSKNNFLIKKVLKHPRVSRDTVDWIINNGLHPDHLKDTKE